MELLLYAPTSPVVDYAVAFLWLMSVGTVFIASVWSHCTGPKENDDEYNELSPKVPFTRLYLGALLILNFFFHILNFIAKMK